MYNMLKKGCENMFLKHLREQVEDIITEAKNNQASTRAKIADKQNIFNEEWSKWTTTKKIKRQKPDKH